MVFWDKSAAPLRNARTTSDPTEKRVAAAGCRFAENESPFGP